MRIVCQQTILMKYHALFVIFEKAAKFEYCRLLQIIGGALRVKCIYLKYSEALVGLTLCPLGNCSSHFVACWFFFQNQLFRKILSGIPSEYQTVWIQIRPSILWGLIWVQTVCKSYQHTTLGDNDCHIRPKIWMLPILTCNVSKCSDEMAKSVKPWSGSSSRRILICVYTFLLLK